MKPNDIEYKMRFSFHKLLPTCLPNVVDNLIKKDGGKLKSFFRKF